MKKLSIITINWNDAPGLRATIESVLHQTVRDQVEHIVVDGGSTDGSVDVLNTYQNQLNEGISVPVKPIYKKMNIGTSLASGEYCLFLNSGDTLHDETTLEGILKELHDEDLITGRIIFNDTGHYMSSPESISLLSLYEGNIPHPAAFIKREWLVRYPYDENLRIVSDWKFFIQMLILGNASIRRVNNIITDYDTNGLSSKNRDICEQEKALVLHELFPERVLIDYLRFKKGGGYSETDYDRFYIKLRNYKAGKVLYSLNVRLLRWLGMFKKSARWAKAFPTRLH